MSEKPFIVTGPVSLTVTAASAQAAVKIAAASLQHAANTRQVFAVTAMSADFDAQEVDYRLVVTDRGDPGIAAAG